MKIIHLSDLHFGTQEEVLLNSLLTAIKTINPDLIIVSGDFTQLGSDDEFSMAKDFLLSLPAPCFSVPGNHDVPAMNLYERFFKPYDDYKKYINHDLCPVLENDMALIAGINTARRFLPHWNWANGAVSGAQIEMLNKVFKDGFKKWKICVLHHPIHKVQDLPIDVTVFGRKRALQCLRNLKVDLILTGHVHHASITTLGDDTHQSVYVSASTALSSRKRAQENGFNVITLGKNSFDVDILIYKNDIFQTFKQYTHRRI